MKNKTNDTSVILKIIATICVIPLIFSSFSSGIVIDGTPKTIVSIFEFAQKGNVFLVEAFICMVLQILVILFLTFYGIIQTTKVKKEKFIGICISVIEFALSIISFVCVLIYCKAFNEGVKYTIGVSPICYLIFGILFAGLMLASYIVPDKKSSKKDKMLKTDENKTPIK